MLQPMARRAVATNYLGHLKFDIGETPTVLFGLAPSLAPRLPTGVHVRFIIRVLAAVLAFAGLRLGAPS